MPPGQGFPPQVRSKADIDHDEDDDDCDEDDDGDGDVADGKDLWRVELECLC